MTSYRPTRSTRWLSLRRVADADDGFGMVELLVAIVLFAILSAAVLGTLNVAIGLTRSDRNRVAASNLAARELEIVRRDFNSTVKGPQTILLNQVVDPTPLPGGTVGQPLVVDNVAYTVTREAQWTKTGAGAPASPCDDGASDQLTAMKVHIEVTWLKMGTIKPVESDTLLTPRRGVYSSTTGHIAVKVIDRNGIGAGNHTVTISGPGGTSNGDTAGDGCALFAFLTPGTYTVSVNDTGFVDRQGATVPTTTVSVMASQIVKATFDYDVAASISATFVTSDLNYPLPAVLDLTLDLGNSGLVPSGSTSRPATVPGATRLAANLWPYPSGYQLWAGDCLDSDPSTTGGLRAAPVTVTPAITTIATVDLGQLAVVVKSSGATSVSGLTVLATHAADSLGGCTGGDSVTLGTTNSSGSLKVSLPYGTWTLQAVGKTSSGAWPVATITRGQSPASAQVNIT